MAPSAAHSSAEMKRSGSVPADASTEPPIQGDVVTSLRGTGSRWKSSPAASASGLASSQASRSAQPAVRAAPPVSRTASPQWTLALSPTAKSAAATRLCSVPDPAGLSGTPENPSSSSRNITPPTARLARPGTLFPQAVVDGGSVRPRVASNAPEASSGGSPLCAAASRSDLASRFRSRCSARELERSTAELPISNDAVTLSMKSPATPDCRSPMRRGKPPSTGVTRADVAPTSTTSAEAMPWAKLRAGAGPRRATQVSSRRPRLALAWPPHERRSTALTTPRRAPAQNRHPWLRGAPWPLRPMLPAPIGGQGLSPRRQAAGRPCPSCRRLDACFRRGHAQYDPRLRPSRR